MSTAGREVTAELMTPRARAYLAATSLFALAAGGWCVLSPSSFSSTSFVGLKEALPFLAGQEAMVAWGAGYLVLSLVCAHAGITRAEGVARTALLLACVLEGMWLGGYLASWTLGGLTSPMGPLVWGVLLAKDAIALSNPMRNAFERVTRRVLSEI